MATTFTNQATLTYNGTTVLSNVAVGIMESALSVTKNAVESAYTAGDVVTYVISIVNSSDTPAAGLTLSDDLGAYPFGENTVQPLSYVDGSVQYYVNGVLQPAPAVETAEGLEIEGISVPAQGNATVIYSAQVNEYAPLEAASAITNTAAVGMVQAQETLPVAEGALLSLEKSVSPVPVTQNGRLTYTFRLTNCGNAAVTEDDGAEISDTFDPLLTDISVVLNGTELTETDYSYEEAAGVFKTNPGVISVPAAAFTQDPATGAWASVPGTAALTVTGTVEAP